MIKEKGIVRNPILYFGWAILVIMFLGKGLYILAVGTATDDIITSAGGFAPFVLGIVVLLIGYRYFYGKREKKAREKTVNKLLLPKKILLVIVIVLIIIFFVGIYNQGSIQELTCIYPKEIVGLRCCISSQDFEGYCQDEIDNNLLALDEALEQNLTTNKRIYSQEFLYSFIEPPDYVLVRNLQIGGFNIDYNYEAYGPNSEKDIINIKVFAEEARISNEYDIQNRFLDGISKTALSHSNGSVSERTVFVNNEGNLGTIMNSTIEINKIFLLQKTIVFANTEDDFYVAMIFMATESMFDYVEEFDALIDSFRFESLSKSVSTTEKIELLEPLSFMNRDDQCSNVCSDVKDAASFDVDLSRGNEQLYSFVCSCFDNSDKLISEQVLVLKSI